MKRAVKTLRIYLWPAITLNSLVMSIFLTMTVYQGLIIGFGLSCLATFGFLINNYWDYSTDLINSADRSWQIDENGRRISLIIGLFFMILGFIFFLTLGVRELILGFIIALLLLFYSLLFRKMLLVANILSGFLILSPLYIPIIISRTDPSTFLYNFLIALFLIIVSREIVLDIKDKRGDSLTGRHTFPTIFDDRISFFIVFFFLLAGCTIFIISSLQDYYLNTPLFVLLIIISIIFILTFLISTIHVMFNSGKFNQYIIFTNFAMLLVPFFLLIYKFN